jgi:protease I
MTTTQRLKGLKIGVLVESDYYEPEIWYYKHRFAEEGVDLRLMSRLWGQSSLTFKGHEYQAPLECRESFEGLSDAELRSFAAVIVPSGMVSDRLRYTDDVSKIAPAAEFLRRAFAEKNVLKGIICHGLWLAAPVAEVVRGRKLVCHNNLYGDAKAYGATYVDEDVVVDGDLVSARSGAHCHQFARAIIENLANR